MYGLIKEAIDPAKGGTQEFKVNYKAGWYDVNNPSAYLDGQNKLTDEIDNFVKTQLIPYLQKVPSSVVAMKFRSGESLVPNTDNEGKDKGKGQPLEPGRLSELRKYYLEQYLNTAVIPQIQNVDKQAEIPELQYEKVDPKEPWIGKSWCKTSKDNIGRECLSAWKSAGYPDRDKYNLDQVSEFSITVTPKTPTPTPTPKTELVECADTIRVRFQVSYHQCQNAEFFVFANSTRLNNLDVQNLQGRMTANLNTGTKARGIPDVNSKPIFPPELLNPGYGVLTQKYGSNKSISTEFKNKKTDEGDLSGVRYDDFEISFNAKKDILSQSKTNVNSKTFINLWFVCTTNDAHDDIVTITVYDGKNNVVVPPFQPTGKNQGLLCTLDECGKKITTIDSSIGPKQGDIDQARKQLIDYKSKLLSNLGIQVNTADLDTKGLALERAGALLRNVKEVAGMFISKSNELKKYITSNSINPKKILKDQETYILNNFKKPYNEFSEEKIRVFFNLVFKQEDYQELLRKNPEDPNSYRRGIMKSDMGGDLRARIDEFYKYFNVLYQINEDGNIRRKLQMSTSPLKNQENISSLPESQTS